jgi:Fe2+ or Zn2+ uptake regulation protein
MANFSEFVTTDRRLSILLVLMEDPGYSVNEYVLQACLEAVGHRVTLDRVKTDLDWLAEQGLLIVSSVSGVKVAKLTGRGADVASGKVVVPGVKRPRPRD